VTILELTRCSPCILSIVRLYTINKVGTSTDLSFDSSAYTSLSSLEVNAGIICACLPAMRPLLALMMPKYFSKAAQFTNVPMAYDIEQLPSSKISSTPSAGKQNKTIRATTIRPSVPMAIMPQAPLPTLSRDQSSHFNATHSRPSTAGATKPQGRSGYISHSRSTSNVSIDIAAADARLNPPRLKKRINPLRLSPVTPYNPLDSQISLPVSVYSTQSDNDPNASTAALLSPRTPAATKPLPITPFPVGGGGSLAGN
jgi:hypothetical protein